MNRTDFIEKFATQMDDWTDYTGKVWSMYLVSIIGILSTMESIDSDLHYDDIEENWAEMLDRKRQDEQYVELLDALTDEGFRMPLTIYTSSNSDEMRFGNGNHRFAAAIDAGYQHIPVVFCNAFGAMFRVSQAGEWGHEQPDPDTWPVIHSLDTN